MHSREDWTTFAAERGLLGDTPPPAPPPPDPRPNGRTRGRNKYGAARTQVDGRWFDSVKEATRYQELKLLAAAGAIANLELQPMFPLHVVELYRSIAPIHVRMVGVYRADFRYCDCLTGEVIVEDVKSDWTKTEAYRLRKRIAEAVHGMTIREVE